MWAPETNEGTCVGLCFLVFGLWWVVREIGLSNSLCRRVSHVFGDRGRQAAAQASTGPKLAPQNCATLSLARARSRDSLFLLHTPLRMWGPVSRRETSGSADRSTKVSRGPSALRDRRPPPEVRDDCGWCLFSLARSGALFLFLPPRSPPPHRSFFECHPFTLKSLPGSPVEMPS